MNDVVITNTVLTAVFTLLMAFFYFTYTTFPGFGQWTIGGGLFASTCLMIALRGLVPISLAIVFQNFLFPLAAIFYLSGTRSFLGLSGMSRGWWALPVISAVFSVFSVLFFDSAAWRTLIVALAYSVPHVATAILIVRHYSGTKSVFSLVLGGEMALAAAVLIVWALWSLTISDFQLLTENPLNKGFFILLLILQAVITFSFLMLNVEQSEKYLLSSQDALKLSEEKFSKAFQFTPDAILITRKDDGKIVEVNKAFSAISGYSREEALSNSSIALNLWENPEDRKKIVTKLGDNKIIRDWEVRFRNKSGESLDCLLSGETFVFNGEAHILSVVRDIRELKRSELELQSTLQRLYTILSSLYAGVLLVTSEGIVEFANEAFCDLFHLDHPPGELHGLNAEEIIGKIKGAYANPEEAIARIMEVVAQNRPVKGEEIALIGGRTCTVDFIPIVIDGEPYGRFWHHTDISERKRTEDALRESEQKFVTTFRNSPVSMVITSAADGKYIEVNDIFIRDTGYTRDEIIGHTSEELTLFTDHSDYERLLSQVRTHGYAYGVEVPLRMKLGETRICSISTNIVQIGGQFNFLSSILDVSEIRTAEKALAASEERFRLAVATSPDAICITRVRDGFFVETNDAFTKLSGYTRNDVSNKTSNQINIWKNYEDRERIVRLLMEKGSCTNQEAVFQRKDGSMFWGSMSASVMSHKGDLHMISITRDISDRLQAEKEKLDLQTRLFQSQKLEALGTLVGGIAHDFNNMLQIILGYSQFLLDDKKIGEPGYKELQTIIQTGQGGADLVQKLLAFGQQGQVFPVPLDLNHQVNQLKTLISHTLPQLVQVDLDLANGPTTIRADHAQIEQLIINLAINASEAMPNGGRLKVITKTVFLNEEYCKSHYGAKPGDYVMLSVSDSGRGMDKQTLARIFDPFFSTKQRGSTRGTGLGLSVVQGIVQQLGGHVTCESQPGKGTTFKVYFPAIEEPVMTAKAVVAPVQSAGAQTILVVEDNIPVAELEQRVLENGGYKVIVATNGQEALEIYQTRKEEISLVILDLLMPEMSGRDCLMELLKIDPSVKVLIASGYAPEDELHKEISPLVKGFVHKPFAIAELLNEARLAMDIKR